MKRLCVLVSICSLCSLSAMQNDVAEAIRDIDIVATHAIGDVVNRIDESYYPLTTQHRKLRFMHACKNLEKVMRSLKVTGDATVNQATIGAMDHMLGVMERAREYTGRLLLSKMAHDINVLQGYMKRTKDKFLRDTGVAAQGSVVEQ